MTPSTAFQNINFNFAYTLSMTNYAEEGVGGSPQGTGTIIVSGMLGGSLGAGRKVNLNDLKTYATIPANGSIEIGNDEYTFTLNSFVPPGADSQGAFGAHVLTNVVPEPLSAVPAALGFVGLAGFLARKRRRNRTAAIT